jgi:hypothetical protein
LVARSVAKPAPRRGRPGPGSRPARRSGGHLYERDFVAPEERAAILDWLRGIAPLWEYRYPQRGRETVASRRRLLRPVYWLGNWQFACLDYYRPPRGVEDRCVAAEPFPRVLARLVERIERRVRESIDPADVPRGWQLNTCLVNLYGSRLEDGADGRQGRQGRWTDSARVGEHRDFEPGPVASVSLGERALLQFVGRSRREESAPVVLTQWLDDSSLQIFAGARWKDETFHRVQRVDTRLGTLLPPEMPDFRTRRVNFTFRFVPPEHVVRFADLGARARADVQPYVEELARSSAFFARELERAARRAVKARE